ncbi:uncharacterized protein Y057_12883 [Fusarium fujikuroi]|nr:uncharacterized protein Y057_12883 [Fusarium fujikuroi]
MSFAPELTPTEQLNKTAEKHEATTGGVTRELANHTISSIAALKPLTSDSKILDNACGTGIVTVIILKSGINPEIHTFDVAENMARNSPFLTTPSHTAPRTLVLCTSPTRIIQEIQAQIHSDETPFKPPVSDIWLDPDHTKALLSSPGFEVTSTPIDRHLGGEMADGVVDLLFHGLGSKVSNSWSKEEKEKGSEIMKNI